VLLEVTTSSASLSKKSLESSQTISQSEKEGVKQSKMASTLLGMYIHITKMSSIDETGHLRSRMAD
jgi:hypothetical protein